MLFNYSFLNYYCSFFNMKDLFLCQTRCRWSCWWEATRGLGQMILRFYLQLLLASSSPLSFICSFVCSFICSFFSVFTISLFMFRWGEICWKSFAGKILFFSLFLIRHLCKKKNCNVAFLPCVFFLSLKSGLHSFQFLRTSKIFLRLGHP